MRLNWLLVTIAISGIAVIGTWVLISPAAAIVLVALFAVPLIPRAAFRFLSSLFLLIAVIALVADLTPMISAGGALQATSVTEHWEGLSPASLKGAKAAISKSAAGSWLWDNVIGVAIAWPTFVLFGLLALVAGVAGRRRKTIDIYAN